MKAFRLISRPRFGLSFLPTHLVAGVSLHSVVLPAGRAHRIRFIHIHVPFFYITISWSTSRSTKFNPF